ncbi:hypothetical protein [Bradyrhizobium embrapense]|uniref:hypothetical protein n=1 Tax=Bradyrhizobium embrapense TaxID=630921 RepID=UPI00067D3E99|nr:hypothetical protein [Bradyrhizobium embrapense]
MKVRELVQVLRALPDQDATVVIGEGAKPETWLIVSGVSECWIAPVSDDHAIVGSEPAIEIV